PGLLYFNMEFTFLAYAWFASYDVPLSRPSPHHEAGLLMHLCPATCAPSVFCSGPLGAKEAPKRSLRASDQSVQRWPSGLVGRPCAKSLPKTRLRGVLQQRIKLLATTPAPPGSASSARETRAPRSGRRRPAGRVSP